jgi:hypothetical protein
LGLAADVGCVSAVATGFRREEPRNGKRKRAASVDWGSLSFAALPCFCAGELACGLLPSGEMPDPGVSPMLGAVHRGQL